MIGKKLFKELDNMDANIYLLLLVISKMLLSLIRYARSIRDVMLRLEFIRVGLSNHLIKINGPLLINTLRKYKK